MAKIVQYSFVLIVSIIAVRISYDSGISIFLASSRL